MRQAIRAAPTLATAVSTVAALAVGLPGAAASATTTYTCATISSAATSSST